MRSIARTLLLCLMVLALPVQAIAGAAMLHCGGLHDRVPAATGDARMPGPCAGHGMADRPSDLPPHTGSPVSAGAVPDGSQPLTTVHHCSACAACCTVLGLPAPAVTLPAGPPQSGVVHEHGDTAESFVPAALDRPPRNG